MLAVLMILAGYAIVPMLVVMLQSLTVNAFQQRGSNRFPAVEIL
jgi:hypothetical protein